MREYPNQLTTGRRDLDQDVSEAIALAEGTHDAEIAIKRALLEEGDRLDKIFEPVPWPTYESRRPALTEHDRGEAVVGFAIVAAVAVVSFLAGWLLR